MEAEFADILTEFGSTTHMMASEADQTENDLKANLGLNDGERFRSAGRFEAKRSVEPIEGGIGTWTNITDLTLLSDPVKRPNREKKRNIREEFQDKMVKKARLRQYWSDVETTLKNLLHLYSGQTELESSVQLFEIVRLFIEKPMIRDTLIESVMDHIE